MNIKSFKLIKEHPTHFELHDESTGKPLNIAKAHVSEEIFKKIRSIPKLADGGEATAPQDPQLPIDPNKAKQVQDSFNNSFGLPKKPKSQAFADGGEAEVVPEVGVGKGAVVGTDDGVNLSQPNGGLPETEVPADQLSQPSVPDQSSGMFPGIGAPEQESAEPGAAFKAPEQADQSSASQNPFNSNTAMGNPSDLFAQSFAERAGANTAVGQAQATQNKQTAQILGNLAQNEKQLQDSYQTQHAHLVNAADQYTQDLANYKIEPYWSKQTTANKIAGALTIGLGAIGQGLQMAGGNHDAQNMGLQLINKAIDDDLQRQKLELGRKESLLSNIYKQTGNLDTAMNLSKMMSLSQAQSQIQQAAANANSDISKQNAINLNGQLKAQQAGIAQQQAMYGISQDLINGKGAQGGQEDAVQQRINQLRQVGQAPVAEQAEKQYVAYKTKQNALQAAQDIQDQVNKLQTVSNRVLNPIQSKEQIDALNARLYPLVMELNPSKRLTEYSAKAEIQPYEISLKDNAETAKKKTQGLINYIQTQSVPTPLIDQWVNNRPAPKYNFPQITTPIK